MKNFLSIALLFFGFISLNAQKSVEERSSMLQENHLNNTKQRTFNGDNIAGNFNYMNENILFLSNSKSLDPMSNGCLQVFAMSGMDENLAPKLVSSGKGTTNGASFLDDQVLVFASTQEKSTDCISSQKENGKYLWDINPAFEIFIARNGNQDFESLTKNEVYDAEASVSPDGKSIVYTSTVSGDLELWTMKVDGSNRKQITKSLGYEGGASFSPDGKYIVFRATKPTTKLEIAEYKRLFKKNLVSPSTMEIMICKADGTELKQVTRLGKTNWTPCFHPSGKKIIFSSNHGSEKGNDFQLYMINTTGTGLEQITTLGYFNAFPKFNMDGNRLIFSSNRVQDRDTENANIFIADWVD